MLPQKYVRSVMLPLFDRIKKIKPISFVVNLFQAFVDKFSRDLTAELANTGVVVQVITNNTYFLNLCPFFINMKKLRFLNLDGIAWLCDDKYA